jgi:hypothetical protein
MAGFLTYAMRRSFHSLNCAMRFALIGFWDYRNRGWDLDGGRARPRADIRRRPFSLTLTHACAIETLSLLHFMVILGDSVCSQIKS